MVLGWRRAFCTSTPKDHDPTKVLTTNTHSSNSTTTDTSTGRSPRFGYRFNFFSSSSSAVATTSNPSTPRTPTTPATAASTPRSPILRCRTAEIIVATSTSPHAPSPSASTPPPRTNHGNRSYINNDNSYSTTPPTTLRCKIAKTSRSLFNRSSNPSSPAAASSPSTFSLIKSNLGLSSSSKSNKSSNRCGICSQTTKPSHNCRTAALFTAECTHAFHLSCLSHRVVAGKTCRLACPVCGVDWKDSPPLSTGHDRRTSTATTSMTGSGKETNSTQIRTYNDDEPLSSPTAGARFNPIPESDENLDEEQDEINSHHSSSDFPGFHAATPHPIIGRLGVLDPIGLTGLEVKISREAAVIAISRSYQTYTAVLKVKTPSITGNSPARAPIDLVVAIDVGAAAAVSGMQQQSSTEVVGSGQLQAVKRAMRAVISSLTSNDRLSIVAFSSTSKRLLALRRMTSPGRRLARRMVEALIVPGGGSNSGGASTSCVNDALRKAAKVLEDRQEKNSFASLLLLTVSTSSSVEDEKSEYRSSSGDRNSNHYPFLSSTSYSNTGIPLHFLSLAPQSSESLDEAVSKCVKRLISVIVSDLRLQLGFASGSAAGEISAAYSYNGRPSSLNPGSPKLGDLCAEEEREILLELRVPASAVGSHQILTVRSLYTEPLTQEIIYGKQQFITVPRPHTVRSSDSKIQQLRSLFLVTRAVAESRRLAERGDLSGAYHLLTSTRSLLVAQPTSSTATMDEFRRMVEAEIVELEQGRTVQVQAMAQQRQRRWNAVAGGVGAVCVDEKGDPLTPTSAWKAAEKLAKVAIMRKSMNRVSDLHGFENARF